MAVEDATVTPKAGRKKPVVQLIGDDEIAKFFLDVVAKGVRDVDVSEMVIDGEISTDIAAVAQVSITVHDADRMLIRSGVLEDKDGELRAVDIELDGWTFRLAQFRKQGDDMVLTFEDRDVAWLRSKKGPRKAASRAKVTRAEYILQLIRAIKQRRIKVDLYQPHKKRTVAKPDAVEKKKKSRAARKAAQDSANAEDTKTGGFDAGTKIAGVSQPQLDNMTVFLQECDLMQTNDKVMLTGLVAGFGESQWSKTAKDFKTGTHQGVFQADQNYSGPGGPIPPEDLETMSHHFLVGGRSFRAGGAILAERMNPNWTPGALALYVEVSDASGAPFYDRYLPKARAALKAWRHGSGTRATGTATGSYYKRYEFKVDKDENYWDAIQRMATEVRWRAWFQRGIFNYYPETALYRQPASVRFREGSIIPQKVGKQSDLVYCSNIDFDWDYRKEVATATITARMDGRWTVTIGKVAKIEGMGPLSNVRANKNGAWLIESVRRPLFSDETIIEVSQPLEPRAEPRSQLVTRSGGSSGSKAVDTTAVGRGANAYVQPDTGNGSFVAQTTRPDGKRVLPNKWLMEFLVELAGATGHTIYTNTFSRHSQFSTSGLQSDHWIGNGADLNTTNHGGNYPNPYGTQMAEEACRICLDSNSGPHGNNQAAAARFARSGGDYTRFTWTRTEKGPVDGSPVVKRYSVQILWGPNVGHTDHVHIGVHPV